MYNNLSLKHFKEGGYSVMTNSIELEVAIIRSGYTKKEIALHLGITPATLYKKINNVRDFKASEIEKLSQLLSIKDKSAIFFCSKV